jgi:hypothetical protein
MVKASAFVTHVHSNAFPVKGCFSPNIWNSRYLDFPYQNRDRHVPFGRSLRELTALDYNSVVKHACLPPISVPHRSRNLCVLTSPPHRSQQSSGS